MKCARCPATEHLLVHARRFRKRTGDYYVIHYCRDCQNQRMKQWWSKTKLDRAIKNKGYELVAAQSNERLMQKYAN